MRHKIYNSLGSYTEKQALELIGEIKGITLNSKKLIIHFCIQSVELDLDNLENINLSRKEIMQNISKQLNI